jgi:DNA polymerase III alpha subunit
MNEPIWVNYHKHTSLSNKWLKDSPLLPIDYWNELKSRYGDKPCIYTTVEHGWAGNYFKQYDDLEKFNKKNGTNIRWIYGAEAYWVKDRHEPDRSNCHIVLLARTDKGRKAINKILSIANKDGYYARPRIDLELIAQLPIDDVMITTACIAFWNKYDDIGDIVRCLVQKFPHFYLEVQAHNTPEQKELNRRIIQISEELLVPIIAGCDSHVITESQMLDRDELLKSGNIHYEDEDGWYMDYPTYDVLFERFKQQGVLTDGQIKAAINNTNVLFEFEDIKLDRSLKVPVIKELRNKTQEERNHIFEQILKDEWLLQKADINKDKLQQYYQEIKHDIGEIEACNMADYFILSYMVMKRGQEKYGGILTPSGRGSAVSMYLNKLLRLTKVDKVNSPVLMYSERFLTKERVLDSHTPPDIDNNVSDRQPFIQAQRDLVGELGTYDLLALGTLKFKAAWKMYARAYNVEPDTANEVSKQIDRYETAKKHAEDGETIDIHKYIEPKYQELVDGCKKYLGIYDTAKGHPCGCLCYEGDIESDIGISLCKSEVTGKEVLVANIESGTIDAFGYLKQDYLIVDSIGLTYDIYKEAGIEPFTVNQLLEKIAHDDATWQIYADGYTQCVNQCEQPKSTQKVMRYKPKNIAELTQFIAAIRPSFQSMYQTFEQRQHFDYGIKALDDLLQDEYCSSSFILYQESLMKVLGFAGFPMSETYTIIKAISKKKDYIIKDAKPKFIKNFAQAILDTGETDDDSKAHELADKVWTIIENSAAYGFNCVSGDTIIKRPSSNGTFNPTVAEMYNIMHDAKYARLTGHKSLHDKYIREGYGYGLSMKNGRIYKNKIVDIYKQPKAMVFLVTTKQGRCIKATTNHKFPTINGIKTVEQLRIGDSLYSLGNYEKKWFNTRVSKKYIPNYPKQGQCGFQTRDNGDSVIMEKFRNNMMNTSSSCEICNKPYNKKRRFEVHHIDMDRTHNEINNYQWLCCSCHKKVHYENGRTKQYENGLPVDYDEIISIEPVGYEVVYDIEMSDDVAHNFVVDNGIVTCNSAHAYCMAIDSVTIAYLKAHYPLEFYKCVLQRFTDKGEKDKVALIKQEMLKRGYKLKDIQFGDDNRAFNIDRANNCIVQTMASIKDMPKSAPEALYELGKTDIKNRAALYQALMDDPRINKKAIEILFHLGYFDKFAQPNRLITEYEIYQKYISAKVLTKSSFDDIMIDAIRPCCGKETEKQFREIDNKALITALIKQANIKPVTIVDRIKWQLEYLGYCIVSNPNSDPNDWLVLDVKTTGYGTAYITGYNLCYGAERTYRANKKFWTNHQLSKGDVIRAVLQEKNKMKKDENGEWVTLNEKIFEMKCWKKLEV